MVLTDMLTAILHGCKHEFHDMNNIQNDIDDENHNGNYDDDPDIKNKNT